MRAEVYAILASVSYELVAPNESAALLFPSAALLEGLLSNQCCGVSGLLDVSAVLTNSVRA